MEIMESNTTTINKGNRKFSHQKKNFSNFNNSRSFNTENDIKKSEWTTVSKNNLQKNSQKNSQKNPQKNPQKNFPQQSNQKKDIVWRFGKSLKYKENPSYEDIEKFLLFNASKLKGKDRTVEDKLEEYKKIVGAQLFDILLCNMDGNPKIGDLWYQLIDNGIVLSQNRDRKTGYLPFNRIVWWNPNVESSLFEKICNKLQEMGFNIFTENNKGENALASLYVKLRDDNKMTKEVFKDRYFTLMNIYDSTVNNITNSVFNKINVEGDNKKFISILQFCLAKNSEECIKTFINFLTGRRFPASIFDQDTKLVEISIKLLLDSFKGADDGFVGHLVTKEEIEAYLEKKNKCETDQYKYRIFFDKILKDEYPKIVENDEEKSEEDIKKEINGISEDFFEMMLQGIVKEEDNQNISYKFNCLKFYFLENKSGTENEKEILDLFWNIFSEMIISKRKNSLQSDNYTFVAGSYPMSVFYKINVFHDNIKKFLDDLFSCNPMFDHIDYNNKMSFILRFCYHSGCIENDIIQQISQKYFEWEINSKTKFSIMDFLDEKLNLGRKVNKEDIEKLSKGVFDLKDEDKDKNEDQNNDFLVFDFGPKTNINKIRSQYEELMENYDKVETYELFLCEIAEKFSLKNKKKIKNIMNIESINKEEIIDTINYVIETFGDDWSEDFPNAVPVLEFIKGL